MSSKYLGPENLAGQSIDNEVLRIENISIFYTVYIDQPTQADFHPSDLGAIGNVKGVTALINSNMHRIIDEKKASGKFAPRLEAQAQATTNSLERVHEVQARVAEPGEFGPYEKDLYRRALDAFLLEAARGASRSWIGSRKRANEASANILISQYLATLLQQTNAFLIRSVPTVTYSLNLTGSDHQA